MVGKVPGKRARKSNVATEVAQQPSASSKTTRRTRARRDPQRRDGGRSAATEDGWSDQDQITTTAQNRRLSEESPANSWNTNLLTGSDRPVEPLAPEYGYDFDWTLIPGFELGLNGGTPTLASTDTSMGLEPGVHNIGQGRNSSGGDGHGKAAHRVGQARNNPIPRSPQSLTSGDLFREPGLAYGDDSQRRPAQEELTYVHTCLQILESLQQYLVQELKVIDIILPIASRKITAISNLLASDASSKAFSTHCRTLMLACILQLLELVAVGCSSFDESRVSAEATRRPSSDELEFGSLSFNPAEIHLRKSKKVLEELQSMERSIASILEQIFPGSSHESLQPREVMARLEQIAKGVQKSMTV